MATFWERAQSVDHVFCLILHECLFVILVIALEDRILILIVPIPGHCLPSAVVKLLACCW